MNPQDFTDTTFGAPYRDATTGSDFWAFRPAPLPRVLDLEMRSILALSEADAALGRLAGAGRQIHDPNAFIQPYVTREALASSRIEGTQASLSEVFQADASGLATGDVQEVWNYRSAMKQGLDQRSEIPLVGRMVRDIHRTLMTGARGEEKRPGEFRDRPVWIGSPTDMPETAVFVPPFTAELNAAWHDWEDFANREQQLPKLIQCALLHYQFETIHPFFDGNGRLGRLLIVFFLVHRAALPGPLLYLSSYLEQHRREYYERLQAVRERGEIQQWLQFFLTAVAVQAEDAVARAETLNDLRERYRSDLSSSRSRAPQLVDLMFTNPVITARRVAESVGMSNQGALKLIRQLEARGWLSSAGSMGRGGRNYWIAQEVFSALSDPSPPPPQGPLAFTIS